MKKTCVQLVISVVLAVFCGWGLCNLGAYALGFSESSRETAAYQEMMITAKEFFAEKSDDIQYAAALLSEFGPLKIIRRADGTPGVISGDAVTDIDEFFGDGGQVGKAGVQALGSLFKENESGCTVYNIAVTEKAIQFYTGYDVTGCVGFLYERVPGSTSFFSTIDLMENSAEWKVFSNSECGEQ